ncbi:MAG: transposase, partial [Chloroflexaceae bacterium]|nr:transposase [Chloroflexaceae bacterium]
MPPHHPDGCGRPRVADRAILNRMLWVFRTRARWKDLPKTYPPYKPAIAGSKHGLSR